MRSELFATPTDVYRAYDRDSELLYVGISFDARVRLRQHRRSAPWWPEAAYFNVSQFTDRWTAMKEEAFTIMIDRPLFNIAQDQDADEAAWRDAQSGLSYEAIREEEFNASEWSRWCRG